jgi:hypothetical protein
MEIYDGDTLLDIVLRSHNQKSDHVYGVKNDKTVIQIPKASFPKMSLLTKMGEVYSYSHGECEYKFFQDMRPYMKSIKISFTIPSESKKYPYYVRGYTYV